MELRISQIAVYPVKSLGAIYPDQAELVTTGFRYDREWMVVDEDGIFVTQRRFPQMALISPEVTEAGLRLTFPDDSTIVAPLVNEGSPVSVQVWQNSCEAVDQGRAAADALSRFLAYPCRLVRMRASFTRKLGASYGERDSGMSVGFADSSPLMLLSEASLEDLNARLDTPVGMDRFRPNLVVAGGSAYQEDGWKRIEIGELRFRVVKDCIRCEIPTIDQETGEKGVEPMETLESYRAGPLGARFGRKVVHEALGSVRVGDAVTVLA